MASIDRTAYPRFKRSVPARELREAFTPTGEEAGWAGAATRSTSHQLALVVMLKCFQRLGYFPAWHDVPAVVVEHVRGCLGFDDAVCAEYESQRTVRHHRWLVRSRLGVQCDGETIRGLAENTIRAAAATKDNPADLINVALEELVRSRCELPGYSTLDEMAARVRAEVNGVIFEGIDAAMTDSDRARLDRLLRVDPVTRRSAFDQLKVTARAATVSKFKAHLAHLVWLDSLGATQAWLAGVPPAKLVGFAGEARVTDVADLRKVGDVKRRALMACLLNTARVSPGPAPSCASRARTRLREQQRADAERLLDVFGEVLTVVRDALAPSEEEATTGEVDPTGVTCERTGRQVTGAPWSCQALKGCLSLGLGESRGDGLGRSPHRGPPAHRRPRLFRG